MKKKIQLKRAILLVAGGVALQAAGIGTASAAQLSYGTLQSPLHVVVEEGLKPYFERVSKSTDGELTGRIFPSSQLLTARGALAGINDGVADSGYVVPAYHATQLPHLSVLSNMATYGKDPLAVAAALNEVILLECDECLADYTAHNAFPLVSYNTTNYVLMCNKPVTGIEDLRGLQVRSTGIMSERLAVVGANPINLASSESAEALERGQVDCIHGPMTWLKAFGLQGSVSDINDARTGSYRGLGGLVINKEVWDELPEDQRQAMIAEAPGMVADIMLGQVRQDKELKTWAEENNIKVDAGSEALQDALARTDQDEALMAKRAKAVGVEDNAALQALFRESVNKWDGIIEKIGHDREAYIDALKREIYSKLKV